MGKIVPEVNERAMATAPRIAFLAAHSPEAEAAAASLAARYGAVGPMEADVIVALGGDGHMLHMLHEHGGSGKPIYGMNRGSVGFLMNEYSEEGLLERLAKAERSEAKAQPAGRRNGCN